MVPACTAKKWADRYRAEGIAGMKERSSRRRHCPSRTPAMTVKRTSLCGGATGSGLFRWAVGWGCRPQPSLRFWCAAGSRLEPHRRGHRRTSEPLRTRPSRLALARRRHQVRQRPLRRGGATSASRRVTGAGPRPWPGPAPPQSKPRPTAGASLFAHPRTGGTSRLRGTAPARPTSAPTRRL
jgi:hypothetical protein